MKRRKSSDGNYYGSDVTWILSQAKAGEIPLSQAFYALAEKAEKAEQDAGLKAPHLVKKGKTFLQYIKFNMGWTNSLVP